jgi:acetoin utilization protein AcuB
MRDLVVTEGDRLLGVVSQLDLYLVQTLTPTDPESAVVEEAMTPQPYIVGPDAPLEQVARTMSRERCSSAVIVEGERVIGLFTISDALSAIQQLLDEEDAEEVTSQHPSASNSTLH